MVEAKKIAVITPGRSHLLDMSKEFIKQGINVTFYTAVPKSRCEKFGLKKDNVISFFWICAPFMFIFRRFKLPFDLNRYIYYIVCRLIDVLSSIFLKKCDIVISISGCSLIAARKAKKKYGALFFCDRGAKHILEQNEILNTIPEGRKVFKKDIPIELKQYQLADYIILPSTHTYESFVKRGVCEKKLFINPYGVSMDMFFPIPMSHRAYDIVFVGNLSLQKGGDLVIRACEELNLKFLHVGNLSDVSFPKNNLFKHIDSVDQSQLNKYYNEAKILCLPSRQDGFGLVLFQAMACGLPLVYSHNTGGPDLRNMIENKKYLIEMEELNVDSLKKALSAALDLYKKGNTDFITPYLTKSDKETISWNGYGKRYKNFLDSLL